MRSGKAVRVPQIPSMMEVSCGTSGEAKGGEEQEEQEDREQEQQEEQKQIQREEAEERALLTPKF